ncbi:MAG: hypothetical protein WCJ01_00565 [Ignavibacteria bacterium]
MFNIYEVSFKVSDVVLFADNKSTSIIEVIPLNSFGNRVPFRKSPAEFQIVEGVDLVEIIQNDIDNGILTLKAKDMPGKITVRIKSEYSLMPSLIEISIQPNAA